MLLRLLPLAALLFVALPAKAEPRKREAFEVAVDNALQYLAGAQNPDGSWNSGREFGGGGFNQGANRDPAISALCVMAFLSAGHVPGEGKYGGQIEKGIRFVCRNQQPNGVFSANGFGMSVMYSHGICTLMVAEAIGLMPDKREAAALRQQLTAAVRLLQSAQSRRGQNDGGWRYSIQPGDADMSVTAWQVMALRAAKNVGCDVPADVIERAVEYVKRSRDPSSGGYRYTPYGHVTLPCTGAAILSLELCGKDYHKSKESLDASEFINRRISDEAKRSGAAHVRFQQHFFYGVYYMSQAQFQIGGEPWKWYREYLHWLLLHPDGNPQRASGFWQGVSGDDMQAGVNYCTSMAVLALTVEYRFLPIYQRGEEPEEREK
jgi:Prenyltransferase and squalene oxidase repeat